MAQAIKHGRSLTLRKHSTLSYTGEPNNFAGGDKFLELVNDEDIDILRNAVPKQREELKASLKRGDIKVYNHRVTSKVISVTVDGGNQPVFPEIPAIGMGLIRVSSSSDNLKKIPTDFEHIVRYRNLTPLFKEDCSYFSKKASS